MSKLLYVFAGSYEQARDYAWRKHNVHYKDVVSIDRPDQISGLHGLTVYVLPTAHERQNYHSLIEAILCGQNHIVYEGDT